MVKKPARQYALVPNALPLALLFSFFFMGTRSPRCTGSSGSAAELPAASGAWAGGRRLWEAGMEMEMEMEMESEASRRVLQQTQRYISYEFLKADAVPCSRPGHAYYNCHALPRANPYSRGCLTITRCARDSGP